MRQRNSTYGKNQNEETATSDERKARVNNIYCTQIDGRFLQGNQWVVIESQLEVAFLVSPEKRRSPTWN
jgi:hypothetical protein